MGYPHTKQVSVDRIVGVPEAHSAKIGMLGLTFDDVLLLPRESDVVPSEADTSARLSRHLTLHVPLVSSAMDTVTESRMAIALAREGGAGVLHRNLPIDEQAAQVDLVKRSEAGMVTSPITCHPEDTIAAANDLMARYRISGVPVTDDSGVLVGIVTNRDIRFETDYSRPVRDVMTKAPLVTAPVGTSGEDAMALLARHRIEKLPLVDDTGRLRGLITVKDFTKSQKYPHATKDADGRLVVGAAVGVGDDAYKRAEALVQAGVDFLVVDTAHGHSRGVIDMVGRIKSAGVRCDVIAGNVATYDGARALVDAGADAVKVGVGPGCFAAGTRVLMADATYKNIEDVRAGDRVITGDGRPTTVVRAWCTGIRDVVAVQHEFWHSETFVTPDHRYLTLEPALVGAGAAVSGQVGAGDVSVGRAAAVAWREIGHVAGETLLMPRHIAFEPADALSRPLQRVRPSISARISVSHPLKRARQSAYLRGALLSVRQTGWSLPVYDIEVEDESHSFIADNAIVHNSICTTRVVAGVGVPQITAILETARAARPAGVPLIADGGMQYSGDIAKAIACGADTVMLGSLLAGVEESPGDLTYHNGKQFKTYRGMGSLGAMQSRGEARSYSKDRYAQDDVLSDDKLVPEGIEGMVPYRGSLGVVAHQLVGGLRAAMGYCGARTIAELQDHAQLVRITAAGLKESHPHDVQLTADAPNYHSR